MERLVVPAERWSGGYYELDVALGSRSHEPLLAALEALWRHPALEGPFAAHAPSKGGVRARRTTWDELRARHDDTAECYGLATLHDGARVACHGYGSSGTVVLSLPGNGLRAVWPEFGEFPFVEPEGVRSWQEPLEEWLADVGRALFARTRFEFARIGFEVTSVDPDEWMSSPGIRPPARRGMGVLRREDNELAWYPTTEWGGPVGSTWEGLVNITPLSIRLKAWARRRLGRG